MEKNKLKNLVAKLDGQKWMDKLDGKGYSGQCTVDSIQYKVYCYSVWYTVKLCSSFCGGCPSVLQFDE